MKIKKTIRWVGLIILSGVVFFLANTAYIREWRVRYAEQRVQKSIVKNYEDKQEQFATLIEYVRKLKIPSNTRIEFTRRKYISGYINSPFTADSMQIDSIPLDLNLLDIEVERTLHPEFEFLSNGRVKISYGDTVFEKNNWYWNFEGTTENPQFEKFINYIGISKSEFETLRSLTKDVDCEAISIIDGIGSFSLRYDGVVMCAYEYFIPGVSKNEPKGFSKLDEGVFCGLNRCNLFCGSVIYRK